MPGQPSPPFEWPRPMWQRRGAPTRLAGIEVWHDFEWSEVFPGRGGRWQTQFPNGRRLAELIQDHAARVAPGKDPILVLTTLETAREGRHPCESNFVVVVRIRDYLDLARADAATSYFARYLDVNLTSAAELRRFVGDEAAFSTLLQDADGVAAFVRWARGHEATFAQLLAAHRADPAADTASVLANPADLARILGDMSAIGGDVLAALRGVLERAATHEEKVALLESLTVDVEGRRILSEHWGRRIGQRIDDALAVCEQYEQLIQERSTSETAMQNFIANNPLTVGLEYLRVIPHPVMPRGIGDFLLERYDGYHDLLELKGPGDRIIEAPVDAEGRPPPPSGYRLSAQLSQALAQVHAYRRQVLTHRQLLEEEQHIRVDHEPWCIVVVGVSQSLDDHERRVLDELNRSLHRVEIVPYDLLAARTRRFLMNLRDYARAVPGEGAA